MNEIKNHGQPGSLPHPTAERTEEHCNWQVNGRCKQQKSQADIRTTACVIDRRIQECPIRCGNG